MPPMEILSDLMLALGAFGAMAYCHILSGSLTHKFLTNRYRKERCARAFSHPAKPHAPQS